VLPPPTPRIQFRIWTEADLPLAVRLWGDPAVTRWIDARGGLDEAAVQAMLARELEHARRHGLQYWPCFLRPGGELVGCCGLRPRPVEPRVPEFGVHLLPEHWGRGLAREAAAAVIAHAFDTLRVPALFAGHHPENQASRRLLAALGFRHTHDERYPATGREHPSYRLEARAAVTE
jgi:RimJ/RimL family protein N-acetyltransferase